MKTLKQYLYILFIFLMGNSFSQQQEVKSLNNPLQHSTASTPFRPKIDTVEKDLTNGLRDDPTLYHKSISRSAGLDSNLRLVYFLHGLGGTPNSWKGSYDGLVDSGYSYFPRRPTYNFGYGTNQKNFKNASFEALYSMELNRQVYEGLYFNYDSVYKNQPPYVIGHSQGGLVARDLDMKHDTNSTLDPRVNYTNRKFWGIITFGTPHAGSYFAVNQDDLSRLASELGTTLAENVVTNFVNGLALKSPMYKGAIVGAGMNFADIVNGLHKDSTLSNFFNMVGKDNRDPITKQYGPHSTYLLDTMNRFINPQMPKGLFYGVEEDPLVWRLTHYMLTKDPGEYSTFGANDDKALAENMEDRRLKLIANAQIAQSHMNWHNRRWWNPGNASAQIFIHSLNRNSNYRVADFLSKTNLLYKVILGSVDESNLYRMDTTGWKCIKRTVTSSDANSVLFGGASGVMSPYSYSSQTIYTSSPSCKNDTSWTTFDGAVTWQYDVTYTLVFNITKTLIETPSDAVVLKPSQMAFPGCLDYYKRPMDEIYVNGQFVKVPNRVNHMQMRNCRQTEAALRRVFEADGTHMNDFFFVVKQ